MRIREHYISKENRDARYKQLKETHPDVTRTTSSGDLLHPAYIQDFPNKEQYDTGFGNTHYKMYHKKLYTVATL